MSSQPRNANADCPTGVTPGSELLLVLPLRVFRDERGRRLLTQKILQGAAAFAERWPGPVTMLVHESTVPFSDLDPVDIDAVPLTFKVETQPSSPEDLAVRLRNAAMVLSFLSRDGLALGRKCKELGVPLIFYSEYSLEVEWQIIDATTTPGPRRWRRKLWALGTEIRRRRALRLAAGVQCSGTPTFKTYCHLRPNALLFFDNRVKRDQVIDARELREKYEAVPKGVPLRLVFGGRLIRMKGVQHLPTVASHLFRSGVPFQLTIYGDGELRSWLVHEIAKRGLNQQVRLGGTLDFETEWLPTLRAEADVFICCHPQGDPSSTYPEVMSCGVPIIGFANPAWTGIAAMAGGGWVIPMNDCDAMAEKIVELTQHRDEIASAATRAREFGMQHALEATFAARVRQLLAASRLDEHARRAACARSGAA